MYFSDEAEALVVTRDDLQGVRSWAVANTARLLRGRKIREAAYLARVAVAGRFR